MATIAQAFLAMWLGRRDVNSPMYMENMRLQTLYGSNRPRRFVKFDFEPSDVDRALVLLKPRDFWFVVVSFGTFLGRSAACYSVFGAHPGYRHDYLLEVVNEPFEARFPYGVVCFFNYPTGPFKMHPTVRCYEPGLRLTRLYVKALAVSIGVRLPDCVFEYLFEFVFDPSVHVHPFRKDGEPNRWPDEDLVRRDMSRNEDPSRFVSFGS